MRNATGSLAILALPCLLLAGAFPGTCPAAPVSRVDMRDYLAPAAVGWSTGWEYADGTTSTAAVRSVSIVDGRKSVTTRTEVSDGSFEEAEVVHHDGFLHYGTITSVADDGAGAVFPCGNRGPRRLHPFEQRIGRTYRSSLIRGDVLEYGTLRRIGRFVRRERVSPRGFADKVTPGGSYIGTLRQEWTSDTRTFFTDGSERRDVVGGTRWFALGQGVVAVETRVLVLRDRAFASEGDAVSGWRTSLTVPPGVPFDLALYGPTR